MKRILTLILIALAVTAQAQKRFDFSVMGGANMGQIDGDHADRYRHLGLRAGVGTSFALGSDTKSPWRMVVELAYTQKGSYVEATDARLSADYVEIPLMLSYTTHSQNLRLSAGVAPALLVRSKVTYHGGEDPQGKDMFTAMDLLPVTVSARWLLGTHLGIEGRYQNSLLSVTREDVAGTYRLFRSNKGCFHNLLSIGLFLQF